MSKRVVLLLVVFAAVILTGCASSKKAADFGDPSSGVLLKHHNISETPNRYTLEMTSESSFEAMGQYMEMFMEKNATVAAKITDIANNVVTHEFKFEKYKFFQSSPQGDTEVSGKDVIGVPFLVTSTETGIGQKFVTKDYPSLEGQPAEIDFLSLILECPAERVKVNDTWNAQQQFNLDKDKTEMQVESDNTYTLIGFENRMGFDCAKIKLNNKASITGDVQQMGMMMSMEGEVTAEGTMYYAYKEGILVEVTSEGTSDISMTVSEMGMTIPIASKDKISVLLVK